jgi:predicted GNAT family acetyltransferase
MQDGVIDNGRGRFELAVEDATAFVTYRRADGVLSLLHTEVPPHLEGKGHGSRLVRGVLDQARAQGEKVRPYCSFIAAFIRRHPEYADLVDR